MIINRKGILDENTIIIIISVKIKNFINVPYIKRLQNEYVGDIV